MLDEYKFNILSRIGKDANKLPPSLFINELCKIEPEIKDALNNIKENSKSKKTVLSREI